MINNNKNGHINKGSNHMETNNNKKTITIIVVALILLILVVGATYAYFTGNIINNSSKTNVKATTSAIDNIALNQQVSKLHITINPNDMGENNKQDYYATEDDNKNYEKTENIVSLAELKATGGDARASYNCEVKVTISIDEGSTMLESLQEGDASIYLQYGNLLKNIDLTELQSTKSKELTGNITLINNSNDFIRGALKITNNGNNQVDLANKTLNVNINTEVTKCELYGTSKIELALRNTSTSGTLSKELKGGMFRYQGSAEQVTDNYICFGTDDQQNCLNHQDQYMYRIIGVTPEGRLKVIKKEALEDTYQWYTDDDTDIEFPESNIFEAISGDKYLKNNNYVPAGWEGKISNNIWTYGDSWVDNTTGTERTGEDLYLIETGREGTMWYEKANKEDSNVQSHLIDFEGSPYFQQTTYYVVHTNEKWSKSFESKVSLMYFHDYYYSVSDEANCLILKNTYEICRNGWIQLLQNDSELIYDSEWTMARMGWNPIAGGQTASILHGAGSAGGDTFVSYLLVRPVFYLNNDIEISGKGTTTEPYMIKL